MGGNVSRFFLSSRISLLYIYILFCVRKKKEETSNLRVRIK